MMNKENDLFLNMLYNPDMSLLDLKQVGLDSTNTGIDSMDSYRENKKVKELFTTPQGTFKEEEFTKAYNNAKAAYNVMSTLDTDEAIIKSSTWDKHNIWAPKNLIRNEPNIKITTIANPMKQQAGIVSLGKVEQPKLSVSEIAQGQKVYDPSTGEWSAAPNDTFMGLPYFTDTLVLATWDEEGEHKDPNTGQMVHHDKGTPKLNDEGTYYYEKLAGRPVYDKQVLNKMNILTPEGSWINKYDFFDSDDLQQKSIFGTVMKNVALIAPMFIPYVGPFWTGISIASQSAGWLATLGKMFVGSDSPMLSEIEGWSKSMNRQTATTDYAQHNTFCWENFINLIGDVVGQLAEQRFIFKQIPKLFKVNSKIDASDLNKSKDLLEKEYFQQGKKELDAALGVKNGELLTTDASVLGNYQSKLSGIRAMASSHAQRDIDLYMKQSQKIGSVLSKTYMTAITTQDMYGEAKSAGATDLEATLLTLGYSAAEAALLNTGIGEHILPELREQGIFNKAIAKALTNIKFDKSEGKLSYARRLFNAGKELINEGTTSSNILKMTGAHALGEGIEEVSEELLADFARSCYNAVAWLQDKDTKMNAWDNLADRYVMSLLGGFVGGGINAPFVGYKSVKSANNITSKQAWQELVYQIRNGNEGDFTKALKGIQIADKNLSATKFTTDKNGNTVYDQAENYEDSQDFQAKKMILKTIEDLKKFLNVERGDLSDSKFLDAQTQNDLRFVDLQQSVLAGKFLQDYQNTVNDIYDIVNELKALGHIEPSVATDNQTDRQKLKEKKDEEATTPTGREEELLKQLSEKRKFRDDLVNGNLSADYIGASLFSMIPAVNSGLVPLSIDAYVFKKEGVPFSAIPKARQKQLTEEYENWLSTDGKEQTWQAYQSFKGILQQVSKMLTDSTEHYKENPQLNNLRDIYNKLNTLLLTNITEDDATAGALNSDILMQRLGDNVVPELGKVVDFINENGYLNAEIKYQLLSLIDKYRKKLFKDADDKGINPDIQLNAKLAGVYTIVKNASETPVEKLLDEFVYETSGEQINSSELLQTLNSFVNSNIENISSFQIDESLIKAIDQLSKNIDILKAALYATKTDNIGFHVDENRDTSDLWGYSKTLNELNKETKDYKNIAEIDSKTADIYINDLDLFQKKITTLKNLHAINNAQKLNKQSNIDLNQTYIFYKKLKKLITTIPDDWDKSKLQAAISAASTINAHADKKDFTLSVEDKKAVKKEFLDIQNAVYDFFDTNKDKEWSTLFNPNIFSLTEPVNDLLNENTDDLSDNSFVWWLATRGAIKATDFYNAYKTALSENLAPIPSQELGIYLNVATVVNPKIFTKVYNAYYKGVTDWFANLNEDEKDAFIKEKNFTEPNFIKGIKTNPKLIANLYVPNYSKFALVEGIAGSGKTAAVISQTARILKNIDPKVLENVWICQAANKDAGIDIANNMGLKDKAKIFSVSELMNTFQNNWKSRIDSKGQVSIDASDAYFDDRNFVRIKGELNALDQPPSLVVIDEAFKLSSADLDIIEQAAKQYGFRVILSGDQDQSKSTGLFEMDDNGNKLQLQVGLERYNFIRSPKLGSSMRTTNSQKDANQAQFIDYFTHPTKNYPIKFHYYEDAKGLNGEKVYNPTFDSQSMLDQTIELLIKTKKSEDEKIGYIYNDPNSETFKHIIEKYGDHLRLFAGGTAQGFESTYYIVETNPDSKQYANDVYTAVTRSSKGSLVIDKGNVLQEGEEENNNVPKLPIIIDNVRDNATTNIQFSADSIKKYSDTVKAELDELITSANKIQLIPENKEATVTTTPPKTGGIKPGITVPKPITSPKPTTTPPPAGSPTAKQLTEPERHDLYGDFPKNITVAFGGEDVTIPLVPIPFSNTTTKGENIVVHNDTDGDKVVVDLYGYKIPFTYNDSLQSWLVYTQDGENTTAYNEVLKNIVQKLNEDIGKSQFPQPNASAESEYTIKQDLPENATIEDVKSNIESALNPIDDIDDQGPIIEEDVIQEDQYKNQLNEENEDSLPNIPIKDKLDLLFYSFNTFESGVVFNSDGQMIWNPNRIDSINGLKNIEEVTNKILGPTYQDYMNLIGTLRSYLLSTESKAEILDFLSRQLNLKDVYLTWAYKKSLKQEEVTNQSKDYQIHQKSAAERLSYIYSNDEKSKDLSRGSFVAIIGTKEKGNLLELPLLSITNPVTIITELDSTGNPVRPDLYNIYNTTQGDEPTKLKAVAATLDKKSDLYNLIQLYDYKYNGVFYLDKFSGIHDWQTWTPAKNLEQLGPILSLGKRSNNGELNYVANWVNLTEYAKNPMIRMSKIMSSTNGTTDGVEVARTGHPFVLMSYDKSISNLFDYYVNQLKDSSVPKKVKLVYVLPPKATLKEFIDNIHNIYTKQDTIYPIGQINTSYKILKGLMNNPQFEQNFKSMYPMRYGIVKNTIDELSNLSEEEVISRLVSTVNWAKYGMANEVSLSRQLDRYLQSLVYAETYNGIIPSPENQDILDRLVGNIPIYWRSVKPAADSTHFIHNTFFEIKQDDNYNYLGRAYQVYGKVDSPVFKGSISSFLGNLVHNKIRDTVEGTQFSLDDASYRERKSKIDPDPEVPQNIKDAIKIAEKLKYPEFKDIDFENDPAALSKAVKIINDKGNEFAVLIDDNLFVSKKNNIFNNKTITISDIDGNIIDKLSDSNKDINSNYAFTLETKDNAGNVETYSAIISLEDTGKVLELTPNVTTASEPEVSTERPELHIPDNDFDAYNDIVEGLIGMRFDNAEGIINALNICREKAKTKNKVIEKINAQNDSTTEGTDNKRILNELKSYLSQSNPENKTDTVVCPITIKIKF